MNYGIVCLAEGRQVFIQVPTAQDASLIARALSKMYGNAEVYKGADQEARYVFGKCVAAVLL